MIIIVNDRKKKEPEEDLVIILVSALSFVASMFSIYCNYKKDEKERELNIFKD